MSAPLHLLGLTGPAASGKDTVAAILRSRGWQSIAFADAVRDEIATAWRVDVRMLLERAHKETPLLSFAIGLCGNPAFIDWAVAHGHSLAEPRSARWLMQRWGTDFRRTRDADYWVRRVEMLLNRWAARGMRHCVVTDVRMPNEAAWLRNARGRIARVHRTDLADTTLPCADTAAHESERTTAAIEADAVIHNDSRLQALPAEVERVVLGLFGQGNACWPAPAEHEGHNA